LVVLTAEQKRVRARKPARGVAASAAALAAWSLMSWSTSCVDALAGPLSGPLMAQNNPFSTLVGRPRRSEEPKGVERYVLASDERIFLFENGGATARIQFLCGDNDERIECAIDPQAPAAEIYPLEATRAPRGDVVYRNASGEVLLRIASYGGATVFWPGEPRGRAASRSFGETPRLDLLFTEYETARRRARTASAMISAKTGGTIRFDLGPPPAAEGADAAVLSDAVVMAAKGLNLVSRDPTGATVIASRIDRVSFAPAARPGVALDGATLQIGYRPGAGLDGRPSSAAVARYLEENL